MRPVVLIAGAVGALALAVVLGALPRLRRPVPARVGELELAILRGGRFAAAMTALVAMESRGEAALVFMRGVRREGVDAGGQPLERALWSALHGWADPRELLLKPRVAEEMAAIERRLAGAGLLQSRPRWWLRRALLVLGGGAGLVAAVVAVVRGDDGPDLVAAGAGAAVVLAALALRRLPRRTPAGRRTLRDIRRVSTADPSPVLSVALWGGFAPTVDARPSAYAIDTGIFVSTTRTGSPFPADSDDGT